MGCAFLAWLVVLITFFFVVSLLLCHVLSCLVSSCVMLFICVMTFCRISFISSVAFSLSLKYILYGVFAVVVLNPGQFLICVVAFLAFCRTICMLGFCTCLYSYI